MELPFWRNKFLPNRRTRRPGLCPSQGEDMEAQSSMKMEESLLKRTLRILKTLKAKKGKMEEESLTSWEVKEKTQWLDRSSLPLWAEWAKTLMLLSSDLTSLSSNPQSIILRTSLTTGPKLPSSPQSTTSKMKSRLNRLLNPSQPLSLQTLSSGQWMRTLTPPSSKPPATSDH